MRIAGVALAGAVWLAAGGVAEAQVIEREPIHCPETFADGGPTPSGAQFFGEYTEATALEWRRRIADAMLCEVGEVGCGPTAQAVFDAARNDHTIVILDETGTQVLSRIGCDVSTGVAGVSCFDRWSALTSSRTEAVTTLDNVMRSDVRETRITGQLGGEVIFDRTVDGEVSDLAAQAALAEATLTVTGAGGPGVVVFDPVLVERTEFLRTRDATLVREAQGEPVLGASAYSVFGSSDASSGARIGAPDPTAFPSGGATAVGGAFYGDFGLCESGWATTGQPSGCENDAASIQVPWPATLLAVNLNTHLTILETITGTETWEIFEHWQVRGVVQALGSIHAAVQSGGYDLGQRMLRRMGDEGAGPRGFALPAATLSGMGGPGVARNDLRVFGAMAETGWHLRAGDWAVTPSVGVDHVRVRRDGFATGALVAASHRAGRTRVFAGVEARRDWAQAGGVLGLRLGARVVHVVAGADRVLPVTFGGTGLAITGAPGGRTGVDASVGVTWKGQGLDAYLRADGRWRTGARDHGVAAGVTVRW
ncbi:MAG: autotransporter domain-containing protein [Gemmobacter sp.]